MSDPGFSPLSITNFLCDLDFNPAPLGIPELWTLEVGSTLSNLLV